MKYSDIKNKKNAELEQILKELLVEIGKMRFEMASKSLKNTNRIKSAKKDIARVKTALRLTSV